MKFQRKPAIVEVGIMAKDSMAGGLLHPDSPPVLGITTENGQTYCVTFDRFLDEYTPADADAEVWFDGLQQRATEAVRKMRFPYGEPCPALPAEAPPLLQLEDEDGNVLQRLRQVPQDKPKKRPAS